MISLPNSWAEGFLQRMPGAQRIGVITAEADAIRWSDNGEPVNTSGFIHYS